MACENLPLDDLELAEDIALLCAQATIQNCLDEARLSRAELAERMGASRSFVTRIMKGTHNLTIRTFARALSAAGFELSFNHKPQGAMKWGTEPTKEPSQPFGQINDTGTAANTEFALAA